MSPARTQMGYECEWISHLPPEGKGGSDFDNATYETKDFETREQALAFAKAKAVDAELGCVLVRRFWMERGDAPFACCQFREYDHAEEITADPNA